MKFYLSGPMRGLPQSNFLAFNKASAMLEKAGYAVYNPTGGKEQPEGDEQLSDVFSCHLEELLKCDAIAVLIGWGTSNGAKLEMAVALASGKETYAVFPNRPPAQMLEKLFNVNIVTRAEEISVK